MDRSRKPSDPVASLREALVDIGEDVLVLACSGGLDSQVLMDAATHAVARERLVVAHVHHGLQAAADEWLAFTGSEARARGLRFESLRVGTDGPEWSTAPADWRQHGQKAGIEAWARAQRYRALEVIAQRVGARCVLSAHHQDDQIETHLMRRDRGAGARGLAAMSPSTQMGRIELLRPFLGLAQSTLREYAERSGLRWIEDPSNRDPAFTRSRLRIGLSLEAGERARIVDSISAHRAHSDAEDAQAARDLEAAAVRDPAGLSPDGLRRLDRRALERLSPDRQNAALRLWLRRCGLQMPTRSRIDEMRRQLIEATGSRGMVRHDQRWLLRHRELLHCVDELPSPCLPRPFTRGGESTLELVMRPGGIDPAWFDARGWTVDAARGRDRFRRDAGSPSRDWRHWCQQLGIPVWARDAIPVIRPDGGTAAPHATAQYRGADDALWSPLFGFERSVPRVAGDVPGVALLWLPPRAMWPWLPREAGAGLPAAILAGSRKNLHARNSHAMARNDSHAIDVLRTSP